jgi:hypothetical protein
MTTKPAHPPTYNATAYHYDEDGHLVSVEAVHVTPDGLVDRACGLWSPFNGTERYDAIWHDAHRHQLTEVDRDDTRGYLSAILRPPIR